MKPSGLLSILAIAAMVCAEARADCLPKVAPATQPSLSTVSTLTVKRFDFQGNTVFSTAKLREHVAKYLNREITLDDLEEARRGLTLLYVNAGYINSGAIVPDQQVQDGVVVIKIIEGHLSSVKVTDRSAKYVPRLNQSYVIKRVQRGAGDVVNVLTLKDELELLRQNPNVKRVNAELRPEAELGKAFLDLQIQENNPFHLATELSNRRPPSDGPIRVEAIASDTNLTGQSDSLNVRYTLLRGKLDEMEWAGTDEFSVDYTRPITAIETAAFIDYSRSDAPVVERPFDNLHITSQNNNADLGLRQPIIRRPNFDTAISMALSFRQSDSRLLGEPFSFSPGAKDGQSKDTAIRFGQELNFRDTKQALALRSTFSFGIDAFGATIHGQSTMADSQFFAWLGQGQYIRRFGNTNNQAILRGSAQLTPNPLLSPEQFTVGGYSTVRGYRENELVRDNAVAATLEFHLPVWERSGSPVIELAPFTDAGLAWDVHPAPHTTRNECLSSIGIGLLAHIEPHVEFSIYFAHPFKDFNRTSDLQDIGIHFDLVVTAF